MLRRDQFVIRYVANNNADVLAIEVKELEKYVDDQLVQDTNILNFVNQNGLSGTSGTLVSQTVNGSYVNNAIHINPNVLDNGSGRTGTNRQYAIWSNSITYSNKQPANTEPWLMLDIDTPIGGELRITLPEGTNKNAAYLLVQKYLGPLDVNSSDITRDESTAYGFWGRKPIIGSNGTSGTIDPNAVRLEYDAEQSRFVIVFTL